jgi:N-methylhydantoinase B
MRESPNIILPTSWEEMGPGGEVCEPMHDAATLSIFGKALAAAAQEMGINLIRAAYSTVVREARDCSAALLDPQGNVIAQAEMIPMMLAALGECFAACAARFPVAEVRPGEAYILNDPYAGGHHLNDIILFTPIFYRDELIGFSGSLAHHLDIGGGAPGANSRATDTYQEGLRIPPMKVDVARDWQNPNGLLRQMITANVRTPDKTTGDINAQFAANDTGHRRLCEVAGRYGTDGLRALVPELLAYTERRARAEIAAIPDGVYHGEDVIDSDGLGNDLLRIAATVTVRGDDLEIDFSGTGPTTKGPFNSPFSSTIAASRAAVRGIFRDSTIPANDGCNRPISVSAPAGCLLNPTFPAPVRARMQPTSRAYDAIKKALAPAIPAQVTAPGFDTTSSLTMALRRDAGVRTSPSANGYPAPRSSEEGGSPSDAARPDSFDVFVDICGGGLGAGMEYDGADATDNPVSNCANTPVEALESDHPFARVVAYELIPDSGGAGQWRGGLGFRRVYEILEDGVVFSSYSDRFVTAAEGLFGGGSGGHGAYLLHRAGETSALPMSLNVELRRGDVLEARFGGGGGFGDPRERDRNALRRDVAEGKVSPEAAREVYGLADD